MNVRKIQLSLSRQLFGAGVMLCALTALAATEGPKNEHEISGTQTKIAGSEAGAECGYELSIRPDPQANVKGILLVKLKKLKHSTPELEVGEIMVWWTTPAGHRSSFPIRPLADNVWASRLVLEPEAGKNRVNVVVLGKSSDGSLGETTELLYEFEMPGMNLKFIAQKGAEKDGKVTKAAPHDVMMTESAEVTAAVRTKKRAPASVPAIVILVVFANAILFIPGLLLLKVHRRFSPARNRFGAASVAKMGAGLNPVYIPILAESGLIDRETGRPLALGQEKSNEIASGAAANCKDLFESTIIDPAGGSENKGDSLSKSHSIESVKDMSDEELYELVGAITDEMEKSGVSDDLKILIRAAERELAQRQSRAEQGGGSQDRKSNGNDSPNRDKVKNLNLKDLSF